MIIAKISPAQRIKHLYATLEYTDPAMRNRIQLEITRLEVEESHKRERNLQKQKDNWNVKLRNNRGYMK